MVKIVREAYPDTTDFDKRR
nr:hypothetical protein [Coxiella-like endosymbiont]